MELICEKYNEKMASGTPLCRHPKEYCKFRTSCIIHFLAGDENEDESGMEEGNEKMIELKFDKKSGLLPAIVQDYQSNEVLMLAFINKLAWEKTLETGKAHYWSRSRNSLWLKGESSKHYQVIKDILVDCDDDTVVYKVEQIGDAACHTGHRSCFYRRLVDQQLKVEGERVFDPEEVYGK